MTRRSSPGPVEDQFQDLLDGLVARPQIHHAVMGVETGDGSFSWRAAAGVAAPEGPPMGIDTPYFIASIDKLLMAAAVLKLCEQGYLGLEDPVVSLLPASLVTGLHRQNGVDRTPELTVRHLLTHTSGLPDHIEDSPRGGHSLVERIDREGDVDWNVETALHHVREGLRPHFPPQPQEAHRTQVRYSDTNFLLLAAILEEQLAESLHAIYRAFFFTPLEMDHTFVYGWSEPRAPTPEPAALWFGSEAPALPRLLRALRSVYSTLEDTVRFLKALVNGELFASERSLALMQEDWRRLGIPLDRAALRAPGWPIEYGTGIMRFRMPRLLTGMYRMPAVVGHSGSTGSWLFYCPDLDVYLTGTVDQVTAGPLPYRLLPTLVRLMDPASPQR